MYYAPKDIQHLAINQAAAYSVPLERGTRVRVAVTDGALIKLCREHLFGGYFGAAPLDREVESVTVRSNIYDSPTHIWESDAEDAELHANGLWDLSGMNDTSQVTLDKAQTDQTHVMEFAQDDQDDELRIPLNKWYSRGGSNQFGIPHGITGMLLKSYKKESDNAKLMQWQIRSIDTSQALYYWDDSAGAWTTTETWNDFAGSTSLAAESFTWNTLPWQAQPAYYSLALRPKSDYASETCSIYSLSVHEPIVASQGFRLETGGGEEACFDIPFRCRLGFISDTDTKVAYISEVGRSKSA